MNPGRIIKTVAVALLISLLSPLTVAADPPPPPEPSPLSPIILPNESFEGWDFPPSGWKVRQKNVNQTWKQDGLPWPTHSGVRAAYVFPDPNIQKELLLTPQVYAPYIYLSFHSMTWSAATCQPVDGVCDLEVWVVQGAWGGGDDIKMWNADPKWAAGLTWYESGGNISLEALGINKPIRIGFRYKGKAGTIIALDDVTMIASPYLNKNQGFELGGKIPTGWNGKKLTAVDRRTGGQFKSGSWSFKMVGSSARKTLFQTMDYPGHANDTLFVAGWSMSKNAKAGRPYQLVVTIFHRDGSKERHKVEFSPGTHPWEFKGKAIRTQEPYKSIKLEIRYWRQTGKAWFDNVYARHP